MWKAIVLLALIGLAPLLFVPSGCKKKDEEEVKKEIAVEQVKQELAATKQRLDVAEERAEHLSQEVAIIRAERNKLQDTAQDDDSDFHTAFVVAFVLVVALVLLIQLLINEQRSRKALVKLLQWLKGRAGGP